MAADSVLPQEGGDLQGCGRWPWGYRNQALFLPFSDLIFLTHESMVRPPSSHGRLEKQDNCLSELPLSGSVDFVAEQTCMRGTEREARWGAGSSRTKAGRAVVCGQEV